VGRPGYINLGRAEDLPGDRSVEAMRSRAHSLLDAAYAAGIRYFDAARSYGLAEEFLGGWLRSHPDVDDVGVGSKWGYTYTADWRVDAPVHEVKDHSVAVFTRQIAETRSLRGDHMVRVGFALETDDVLANARVKLEAKGLDFIVVNDALEPGAGFAVDTNRVTLVARDGSSEEMPLMAKSELADVILDRIEALFRER